MLSVLMWVLNAIPGLASRYMDYQIQKADKDLQGFTKGAEVDLVRYQAYLSAQVETNRMKLAQQGWFGAKLIILMTGIPASAHFAAVCLDTVIPPFGSWGIPKLPAPYDTYQWAIVQSFFLVLPVQTGVSAVAQWLNRKR